MAASLVQRRAATVLLKMRPTLRVRMSSSAACSGVASSSPIPASAAAQPSKSHSTLAAPSAAAPSARASGSGSSSDLATGESVITADIHLNVLNNSDDRMYL